MKSVADGGDVVWRGGEHELFCETIRFERPFFSFSYFLQDLWEWVGTSCGYIYLLHHENVYGQLRNADVIYI